MYLLLQDAYSKWPEVVLIKSTSALATINSIRSWFARFGLPVEIVSDNGRQFGSEISVKYMALSPVSHPHGIHLVMVKMNT